MALDSWKTYWHGRRAIREENRLEAQRRAQQMQRMLAGMPGGTPHLRVPATLRRTGARIKRLCRAVGQELIQLPSHSKSVITTFRSWLPSAKTIAVALLPLIVLLPLEWQLSNAFIWVHQPIVWVPDAALKTLYEGHTEALDKLNDHANNNQTRDREGLFLTQTSWTRHLQPQELVRLPAVLNRPDVHSWSIPFWTALRGDRAVKQFLQRAPNLGAGSFVPFKNSAFAQGWYDRSLALGLGAMMLMIGLVAFALRVQKATLAGDRMLIFGKWADLFNPALIKTFFPPRLKDFSMVLMPLACASINVQNEGPYSGLLLSFPWLIYFAHWFLFNQLLLAASPARDQEQREHMQRVMDKGRPRQERSELATALESSASNAPQGDAFERPTRKSRRL